MAWASSPTADEVLAFGAEHLQDLGLEPVGVLILVHQHAVEALPHGAGGSGIGQHAMPEEQQVVVVEDALVALVIHIGGEQTAQVFDLVPAPGEVGLHRLLDGLARVDAATVDVHAGALEREAAIVLREAQLGAEHAHEVFGVAPVEDGEGWVEPDGTPVEAEKPGGRGVEGAPPDLARGKRASGGSPCGPDLVAEGRLARLRARRLARRRVHRGAARLLLQVPQDAVHAPQHLAGGAPGEGQQQDAARVGAGSDLVGDTVGQGGGLARAGAGHDQQGSVAVKDGRSLLLVQLTQDRPDGRACERVFHPTGGVVHVESCIPSSGEAAVSNKGYRAPRTDDRSRGSEPGVETASD